MQFSTTFFIEFVALWMITTISWFGYVCVRVRVRVWCLLEIHSKRSCVSCEWTNQNKYYQLKAKKSNVFRWQFWYHRRRLQIENDVVQVHGGSKRLLRVAVAFWVAWAYKRLCCIKCTQHLLLKRTSAQPKKNHLSRIAFISLKKVYFSFVFLQILCKVQVVLRC